MENAVGILLLSIIVMIMSFYVYETERKLLRMEEKLLKQEVISNTTGSVAFTASLSDAYQVIADEIIKFDTVWVNIGDGYDPESGVFTAPKSGLYVISNTIRSNGDDDLQCSLWVNDESTVFSAGSSSSSGTLNILMMIQKGDRICITSFEDFKKVIYGDDFSMFSAF